MRHSTYLQPYHKRSTYQLNKLSKNVGKPTKVSLGKVLLVWGIALSLALPVFRSGIKSNLTLVEFILNHTTFSKDPEYIPREEYEDIFRSSFI